MKVCDLSLISSYSPQDHPSLSLLPLLLHQTIVKCLRICALKVTEEKFSFCGKYSSY